MADKIYIYGKEGCPYTKAARDNCAKRKADFEYIDVLKDAAGMKKMLEFSKGVRKVPVIVDAGGKVIIGFGGT